MKMKSFPWGPILKRLILGNVYLLTSCILSVGLSLLQMDSFFIPTKRSLVVLAVFLGAIYKLISNDKSVENNFFAGGICGVILLLFVSLFFNGKHPLYQYAAVRTSEDSGFILEDDVYFRWAPIVKRIENKGKYKNRDGYGVAIERYLYSPRIGVVLGKHMGIEKGAPMYFIERDGIKAWFFGARAACEMYAFYAINLTPAFLLYALIRIYKKPELQASEDVRFVYLSYLSSPFIIGLIPLLSD